MRRKLYSLGISSVIACLIGSTHLIAESEVPTLVNYQALVTDINGDPLADTNPENFDVIFRFYESAQGGSSVYTEVQTVTIFQGNLNTLLGQGVILDVNPADSVPDEPKPDLDTIFDGEERFLGITVDENRDGLSDDGEVSPRQQIVANPFAFRAKIAERAHTLESPDGSATDAVSIDGTGLSESATAIRSPLSTSSGRAASEHLTVKDWANTGPRRMIFYSVISASILGGMDPIGPPATMGSTTVAVSSPQRPTAICGSSPFPQQARPIRAYLTAI